MKDALITLFAMLTLLTGSLACKTNDHPVPEQNMETGNDHRDTTSNQLKIRIGSKIFTAKLLNSATGAAFKARLPLTISMSELNGNEKLYRFPSNLPVGASNPGRINTGELMIYGDNTLVLFYRSFPTSYPYTTLGRINDTTGLAAAVGSGSVIVSFELQ